jgi:hypothetical protein
MPPTTPPAIAPAGAGVDVDVGVGVRVVDIETDVLPGTVVEELPDGDVTSVAEDVLIVKGVYLTVVEPPVYVGYTVMTVSTAAQP